MAKAKYEKNRMITMMRSFERSECEYFKLDDKTVRKNVLEKMVYKDLMKAMKDGRVYTTKKVGDK